MNILIFGPNGSGKGTQSDLIRDTYPIDHIESGQIFRSHIEKGTELGQEANRYIEKGMLVPDSTTVPMVLETLSDSNNNGWLLDGFPRNREQARVLLDALTASGTSLDYIIEIVLDRETSRNRIMGRRICSENPHHPNNVAIEAIAPVDGRCRVCGADLTTRDDDQDTDAINQRHSIYYDGESGTLAAVSLFVQESAAVHVQVDGSKSIDDIRQDLLSNIRN